ncbi:MAG: ArsR family transcriptional regulator [Methanobacteriaceae archaeon]|nr:ArsR family transcriptional regulator [Methanobacteriaceae archaeon]
MNCPNTGKKYDNTQIELFASSNGIVAINSPIRLKILSMLKDNELNFDQIVANSGKAKSTVSSHLKKLVADGIIASKKDPKDARKKIFYIKSEYLGELSQVNPFKDEIENYVSSYLSRDGDPFEFFRLMFKTIRMGLISQGINIDPILHEAGIRVGKELYPQLADETLDKFLKNIANFWDDHQLGQVEVKNIEPLEINIYDCFECRGLPNLGKPACSFDAGILKALFTEYYKNNIKVDETRCYALGDDHCCFLIE